MATEGRAVVTLPTDTQILITREFAAPPHLVFKAWTTPALIRRWWHAGRGEVTVAEVDLRVGGRWRYVMLAHGRLEVAFHGVYHEIVPNRRIVSTEVYEAMPDGEALDTITFAPVGRGRTKVSILVEHSCREHRDAHINSGMEEGLQVALELLERAAIELH